MVRLVKIPLSWDRVDMDKDGAIDFERLQRDGLIELDILFADDFKVKADYADHIAADYSRWWILLLHKIER